MKKKNQQEAAAVPEKKRHTGLILVILLVFLACAGLGGFYFYQRQKPQNAVKEFLEYVKQMNYDGMISMLQSEDLSSLENTDIRSEAFASFFGVMNQKMTYKIVKTHFDIQNGTANVTARIRYVNGTDLFKEASSEFARQIVSAAFAGTEMTEEELHQKLADILMEKSASVEEKYLITEIVYPLVYIDGVWKIVALDDETINVMSANFHSVEAEVEETLEEAQNGTTVEALPAPSEDSVIDMTNEKFTIHYTQFRTSTDFAGNPCILVYYDYTNNGNTPSSAMVDVNLKAYQNGAVCEAALPETTEDALDKYMEEVQPGATINVCQAFTVTDQSDVALEANEAFSFGGGQTTTQILKLK